jgi:hypothetical protein
MEIIAYQVRKEVAIVVFGSQTRVFRKVAAHPASYSRELTSANDLHGHLQNAKPLHTTDNVDADYAEALAQCFNIARK